MPKSLSISLDGRSGARVRELDFDLTHLPVSTRTSKGLTITKWLIKEVTASKLSAPAAKKPEQPDLLARPTPPSTRKATKAPPAPKKPMPKKTRR